MNRFDDELRADHRAELRLLGKLALALVLVAVVAVVRQVWG